MHYILISTKINIVLTEYLDGEVSGSSSGHTNNFKNGTYCSLAFAGHNGLSKGNILTRKRHTLYNGTPDKSVIIQGASCLIR